MQIGPEDLSNAKLDVDHIAELATSTAATAVDRKGNLKLTWSGIQETYPEAVTVPALAAPEGAKKVGATLDDPGATPTDSARLMSDRPSISNFGAPVDGVTPSNASFQEMAAACDARLARFIYVPSWNTNHRIAAPVVVNSPGIRIFGDHGGSYNRGTPKRGWLEAAAGITRMIDLGNSRTTGNPADNWQIDGISLRQAAGVTARTVDGIAFTSRTNGPDRGVLMRSVSFIGLKDAITIENPDISANLATLDIQSCVFQGCISAINAKGRMFAFRFVGNQCEQNIGTNGVIRGSIDGPITIDDNILEGQPNAISIDIPPTFGNSPSFRSSKNYFEANSGDYVYRFRNSAPANFTVGPNYNQNITSTDYILVQDSLSSMLLDAYDPYPVAFDNAQTTLRYGSNILRNPQRAYKVRRVGAKPTEVVISDFAALLDDDPAWTTGLPGATGTVASTPYGSRLCALNGAFVSVPLAVTTGDLIVFNVLCRAEQQVAGNLNPQVWNQGQSTLVKEWGDSGIASTLIGRWAVVSFAFVAQTTTASMLFRLRVATGTYTSAIAGIAARNFGTYANTISDSKLITPVRPYLPEGLRGSAAYTPPSLAAGAIGASTTITVNGADLGDSVTGISFSLDSQGVEFLARVSAPNTVTVIPRNPTAGSISLGAGTIRAMVKKA